MENFTLQDVNINCMQRHLGAAKGGCSNWAEDFKGFYYQHKQFVLALIFTDSALWADSVYKSICPSVCLSVCPSVCLSVCVFTFELSFKRLFAPTSWSRMSNIFRDSESLGKSNGKKWSHIWTFVFENCQKLPRKKKSFFFADFAGLF